MKVELSFELEVVNDLFLQLSKMATVKTEVEIRLESKFESKCRQFNDKKYLYEQSYNECGRLRNEILGLENEGKEKRELETINKLYLELSQIATAKTKREIEFERHLADQKNVYAEVLKQRLEVERELKTTQLELMKLKGDKKR